MCWQLCCRASPTGPRQQINEATAWLDASSIYGETAETAKLIRAGELLLLLLLVVVVVVAAGRCLVDLLRCNTLGLRHVACHAKSMAHAQVRGASPRLAKHQLSVAAKHPESGDMYACATCGT
jgi:hypothetical protein